jgi:hypothetical protein
MNRREALQLLMTGIAIPLVPRDLLASFSEARAALETPASTRTLNAHQEATVRTMAELILPKTDTPGATEVGATEFIDLILTEWYGEEERTRFLNGLADVDSRSHTLFGNDFVDCPPVQQAEILTALGEKLMEEAEAMRDQPRLSRGARQEPKNFYLTLRRLTLTAYYTSEAGATAELNFQVIPDRHAECADIHAIKTGTDQ